ncbi:hypothetical protein HPA05_00295 [Streptococcus suis]|nr:hypothetical protein [Streptococcus suis]
MNKTEYQREIGKLRSQAQSFLNDTYTWVTISLDAVQKTIPDEDNFFIKIPKAINYGDKLRFKEVPRGNPQLTKDRIIRRDIINSAYVSIISAIEDFFSKALRLMLTYDSRRLKVTISQIPMSKEISIIDFLDKNREQLIDEIIFSRLNNLFYASPKAQLEYIKKITGIAFDGEMYNKWIELKAKRDIIVHNDSTINDIYLQKTGSGEKELLHQKIEISRDEFARIIAFLKKFVGTFEVSLRSI